MNLRQVQRRSGIPLATTSRLLNDLEERGVLRTEGGANGQRVRRFYPAGEGLHARERVLLGFLSKPRPREMLETIRKTPGIRHSDLADAVGLPAPTATYYMKQMVAADLVVVRQKGVEKRYRVKNPAMLDKAIARTRKAFDTKWA